MGAATTGVPGWVDLGSPDLEASKRFYSELFGWEPQVSPDEQFGGYTIFTKDGKSVAGAGPLMSEGQPPAWATYVIVDDAEGIAARVDSAGGKVIVAPFDVADQGRMGVFLDQSGAAIGVWQPGAMTGADLFNKPGSLSWNELATRDPDGSKTFYGAVFNWQPVDSSMGEMTYTEWKLDGKSIGGMIPMTGDMWPADLPPHWTVYFAVENCDDTVAMIGKLGGTITQPPVDIPQGRFASAIDPQGAAFSIIALAG
jgi:predicted enzyme related to lactoylglutathione lyase